MKIGRLCGAFVALAVVGVNHGANATTWLVNCNGNGPGGETTITVGVTTFNFGVEPGAISGNGPGSAGSNTPDALGALLGTPNQGTEGIIQTDFSTTLNGGDLVEVTGYCNQLVQIRTSGITVTGHTGNIPMAAGPPGTVPPDGDSNQVIVNGAQRVTFNDLLFGSPSTEINIGANTGFGFAGTGLLSVADASAVALLNSEVENSGGRGIFVTAASQLSMDSSLVTKNGVGNAQQNDNMGIFVSDTSALTMGINEANGVAAGADPAEVSDNAGDGIRLQNGSTLTIFAGTVTGNGQKQIFLLTSSAASLKGNNAFATNGNASLVSVTAPPGITDATIAVQAASSLLVYGQATVSAGTTGSAIDAAGSSTVVLQGSFVSGGTSTIEITGGSLLELAGGNYICSGTLTSNSATPTCTLPTPYPNTDEAIEIDHVGALDDVGAIPGFNFTAAADTITGNGVLQLQSTADLGAGLVSSAPSLVWTTGAGGINVSQNSSLRLEGGVAITGTVILAQGSNGFVNASKSPGTPNTLSGSIYCPFTNVAASHLSISGTTLSVTPTPPTLATSSGAASPTGSAGAGGPNTEGTCLTF